MNRFTLLNLSVKGMSTVKRFRCRVTNCSEWDQAVYVREDIAETHIITCRVCNRVMTNFGGPNHGRVDVGGYGIEPITITTT